MNFSLCPSLYLSLMPFNIYSGHLRDKMHLAVNFEPLVLFIMQTELERKHCKS